MKKTFKTVILTILCFTLTACSSNSEMKTQEIEQMMEIETEYGSLYYPAEWEKDLITEEKKEDGMLSVSFYANTEEQQYELFQLLICEEEGDSVGILTDKSGIARNVFVDIHELTDISDLDENVQNQLYAMQEGVNSLIDNLQ